MPRVKREGEKNEEAETRDSGFVRGEGGEKREVERRGDGIDEETRGCGDGDARGRCGGGENPTALLIIKNHWTNIAHSDGVDAFVLARHVLLLLLEEHATQ